MAVITWTVEGRQGGKEGVRKQVRLEEETSKIGLGKKRPKAFQARSKVLTLTWEGETQRCFDILGGAKPK